MLVKRFNNKRLNFPVHIREIFGLESVNDISTSSLRTLSDKMNSHIRAPQAMGNKENLANALLIHIVGSKLDVSSQIKWEENTSTSELPSWLDMETFLEKRCQMLENVANALVTKAPCKQVGHKIHNSKKSLVVTNVCLNTCVVCESKDHAVYQCPTFLKMSPFGRFNETKRLQLCLNCLRKGHRAKVCRAGGCTTCSKKQNSLLHMQSDRSECNIQSYTKSENNSSVLTTLGSNSLPENYVLLQRLLFY